ncbi:UbiA family prenyltransferase [Salinigranum sp. GCM10025319]|uniref:UbiA family prenyltransferase n=1 Tax=Salinigranum sp. GCM10025319 TaxID=3252687 RepID=UPI003615EF46
MTSNREEREVERGVVGGVSHSLGVVARLVRLPNLFTAPPDVILGAALVAGFGDVPIVEVAGLAVASVSLYAGGTTLNDYADAAEDDRERPERPIPSGEVSRRHALLLGVGFLGGGVAIASIVGGALAGVVAATLALLVGLYDGLLKGTAVGYLAMGGCRGTNVLLGTTVAGTVTALPAWALAVPAVVALYIASVTSMAERETETGDSRAVLVAVAGVAVAAAGVVGVIAVRSPSVVATAVAGVILLGFVGWTGRALSTAYADPRPGTIGPAVGACVLGLVVLDAAFAATTGVGWALATAAFVVPAVGLSTVFDVS